MKQSDSLRAALLGGLVLLASAPPVRAAEPARQFLEGLRERGYYDVALDYLEQMQDSPLAPTELREVLLYEQGVTLIESARTQRDAASRQQQLDQAQAFLEKFLQTRAQHPRAVAARSQLANLLVERGRLLAERAKTGQDQAQLAEAKKLYEQAHQVFTRSQEELRVKLEQMQGILDPEKEAELITLRDRLRADYLETQLLAAAVLEEQAELVPKDSPRYRELLDQAGEQYGDIYEKYWKRLAGLYARLYQGRVNQKLGKHTEALTYYSELLDQPDSPPFRTLKTKALQLALDSWLDPALKRYPEGIQRSTTWLDQATAEERAEPDWLGLQIKLARAHVLYAEQLKQSDARSRQISDSLSQARELARFVSRQPGQWQAEAQHLLADLGGPARAQTGKDPQTFAAAKAAAQDAMQARASAALIVETVLPKLDAQADGTNKEELQQRVAEARQSMVAAESEALHYFQLAAELAAAGRISDDPEVQTVDQEELNLVRYYLAFLHYGQEQFYEAAVLGEFIARYSPESAVAQQSAEIALASYLNLYNAAASGDSTFETTQALELAEYIVGTWPDAPQAGTALNTLISFTIKEQRFEKTLEYLSGIPTESPLRADAELKTGRALWNAYLQGLQQLSPDEDPAAADESHQERVEELRSWRQQAQDILLAGIERQKTSGEVTESAAKAALALTQIYVDRDQTEQALALLEDERWGPLTLIEQKHELAQDSAFAIETYKTALRAYISALPTAANSDALVAKADGIMDAMKAAAGDDPDGKKLLISVYISLARDLQQQMESATPESRSAISKGFETFLRRVGTASGELNVLNWVAETFYAMAESYSSRADGDPGEADRFYQQAMDAYQRILDQGEQQPGWLDPAMRTQIQLRLAMARRQAGQFKEAMNLLEQLLLVNNMLLNVQMEAARTYEAWAAQAPSLYERAIKGGRFNKQTQKYTIWGWGRISQITSGRPQFSDQFFEARYRLAACRFKQAQVEEQPSQKTELLKAARRDIQVTLTLYPQLGGQQWKPQFDGLVRSIQRELGEPPRGLAALEAN